MTSTELAFEKGLPANLDAERFVLGSILLNDAAYLQVAGAIEPQLPIGAVADCAVLGKQRLPGRQHRRIGRCGRRIGNYSGRGGWGTTTEGFV